MNGGCAITSKAKIRSKINILPPWGYTELKKPLILVFEASLNCTFFGF